MSRPETTPDIAPQTERHTEPRSASLDDTLDDEWRRWVERGRERVLRQAWSRRGAEVTTPHGPAIDFSSNDYLGLASDARLADAVRAHLERDALGATASRLIAGNHPEHERLESALAEFFGVPAAVSFSTGFAANVGTVPALVGPRDAIFADALNHASLIDGCRLSGAAVHVYAHADAEALRALLTAHRASAKHALIVTDGLFSMDGDRAPLPDLIALASEFGAWTYVDDAHAVGAIGATGRGTAEAAGVHGQIDVTIGTLGKAFGVAGAFAYGSERLKRHLINRARSFVFSTAMLPVQALAARESLAIVAAEPARRARLHANSERLRAGLSARGATLLGPGDAHVVPMLIGDADETLAIGGELRKRGLLVGAVRPPTVAEGSSRLRISVSAAHTDAHVDALVAAIGAVRGSRT